MSWLGIATMEEEVSAQQAWGEDRLLIAALARRGIEARHVRWTAPDSAWEGAAACLVRSVWDYTRRPEAFLEWTHRIERLLPVWNPPALVRWNSHKAYLFELEARGVPLPRTWRVPQGGALDLAPILREHGGLVVKPIVDVGALGALRVSSSPDLPEAQAHLERLVASGEALVQPFLRSVPEKGELSLLFLGGEFSHAVRKVPKAGDYRVQAGWGGRAHAVDPSPAELALARLVLENLGHETVHARVDVVEDNDGRPVLMEVEAIEPHLYFDEAPGSVERYADVLARRLHEQAPAPQAHA